MTDPRAHKRLFIEGLRGYCALQVVLLHYCAALLPVFARVGGPSHFSWEATLARSPWFELIDGYSAVYLFFIMSGVVLTPSFLYAQRSFARLLTKRFLRLFLPLMAAFCIAALLLWALPDARQNAYVHSQSAWLNALGHNRLDAAALARDGLLNAMLIGYQGSSLFPTSLDPHSLFAPAPIGMAVNAPMWTLHVEFWGSLLLLSLTFGYRRLARPLFWSAFALLALVVGTSHYALFMLGFVLYLAHARIAALRQRYAGLAVAGALLILVGLVLCVSKDNALVTRAGVALKALTVLSAESDFHWQSELGAMLIFCGILFNGGAQRWLSCRPALWMGKVSFSAYLLHFPILLTVGCLTFAHLAPFSYWLAVAGALVLGLSATYGAAALFERLVDRPALAWSRRLIGAATHSPGAAGVSIVAAGARPGALDP